MLLLLLGGWRLRLLWLLRCGPRLASLRLLLSVLRRGLLLLLLKGMRLRHGWRSRKLAACWQCCCGCQLRRGVRPVLASQRLRPLSSCLRVSLS